jgi:hypothetical protein
VGFWRLARQEFLVAAGNPKAILLFTAFLPQFVDPSRPVPAQFAVLGALFLLLEWIAIGAYAWMGLHAPLVRRAARQTDLQPLLRRAAVGGRFGAVVRQARLSLGRAFEFDLIAVRVEAIQRQAVAFGAEASGGFFHGQAAGLQVLDQRRFIERLDAQAEVIDVAPLGTGGPAALRPSSPCKSTRSIIEVPARRCTRPSGSLRLTTSAPKTWR